MKKGRNIALIICIFLIGLAIFAINQYGPVLGIYLAPPTPQNYAKIAIEFMDEYGIYSDTEEWDVMQDVALEQVKTAKNYEDTYEILEAAAKTAGGKHSFLQTPAERDAEADSVNGTENAPQMPKVQIDDGIMTIRLPAFSGSADEGQRYAETVTKEIKESADSIEGVILDLRGNIGGDMGPMLAAVSPLLPDGELLHFAFKEKAVPVMLQDGAISGGGMPVSVEAFKVHVPVAVLTDEWTASSAEAVLLAFRGLDYVKTFGGATAGYASCNNLYYLYDGAVLALTIGCDVARTGEVFCEEPVEPDVITKQPEEEAIIWLSGL